MKQYGTGTRGIYNTRIYITVFTGTSTPPFTSAAGSVSVSMLPIHVPRNITRRRLRRFRRPPLQKVEEGKAPPLFGPDRREKAKGTSRRIQATLKKKTRRVEEKVDCVKRTRK
jgi:hypothetical protein